MSRWREYKQLARFCAHHFFMADTDLTALAEDVSRISIGDSSAANVAKRSTTEYPDEFKALVDATLQLAEYIDPCAVTWNNGDEENTWMDAVKTTDTSEQLMERIYQLSCLIPSLICIEEVKHYAKYPILSKIAPVLLKIELCLSITGHLSSDFQSQRNSFVAALSCTIPPFLYPRDISREKQIEQSFEDFYDELQSRRMLEAEPEIQNIVYFNDLVQATIGFDEYMIPEAMKWQEGEHEEWLDALRTSYSTEQLAELILLFSRRISSERQYGQWKGEGDETLLEHLKGGTLKGIAAALLRLEVKVMWPGVTKAFYVARDSWRKPIQHKKFPDEPFVRIRSKSARK